MILSAQKSRQEKSRSASCQFNRDHGFLDGVVNFRLNKAESGPRHLPERIKGDVDGRRWLTYML